MAERVASTAMFSSIVTGLLVAVMLLLALNPVLKFMGAIPSIFDLAKDYAVLFIISTIFQHSKCNRRESGCCPGSVQYFADCNDQWRGTSM